MYLNLLKHKKMMMTEVLQMFTTCLCNAYSTSICQLPHKLNINRREVISIFNGSIINFQYLLYTPHSNVCNIMKKRRLLLIDVNQYSSSIHDSLPVLLKIFCTINHFMYKFTNCTSYRDLLNSHKFNLCFFVLDSFIA